MIKKKKILLLSVLLLVVGFVAGIIFKGPCRNNNFSHINPLLECGDVSVVSKHEYAVFKGHLLDYIKQRKNEGAISEVAVYFIDLQNGPTLGIDEHEKFSPASLLKLPMLLTYLDVVKEKPSLLQTSIVFDEAEEQSDQHFVAKETIQEGTSYTVEELLNIMIKYSDNRSYFVLRQYLQQLSPDIDLLQKAFSNLGIVDPKNNMEQTLSVKGYASIFVQLYNNSFFSNKDLSEKALNILSQTDFTEGIVAGVPEKVTVAHKFGERSGLPNGAVQLHDCGIVYYPKNPYLLCVMTRGNDFTHLSSTIAEISRMIYNEFDSRKL